MFLKIIRETKGFNIVQDFIVFTLVGNGWVDFALVKVTLV